MVMHFDELNKLDPPPKGYASKDTPSAGVTNTKVYPSIIHATFKPVYNIEMNVGDGNRKVIAFPQVIVDELAGALGGLEVRIEENPPHFSHDMQPGHEFVPHIIMLCFPTIGLGAQINIYADGTINARREYLGNPLYRQALDIAIKKLFHNNPEQTL